MFIHQFSIVQLNIVFFLPQINTKLLNVNYNE